MLAHVHTVLAFLPNRSPLRSPPQIAASKACVSSLSHRAGSGCQSPLADDHESAANDSAQASSMCSRTCVLTPFTQVLYGEDVPLLAILQQSAPDLLAKWPEIGEPPSRKSSRRPDHGSLRRYSAVRGREKRLRPCLWEVR